MAAAPRACVAGVFPPPHHGLSNANQQMASRFEEAGFEVRRTNLSPGLAKGPWSYIRRMYRVAIACFRLAMDRGCKPKVMYLGVSGGWGRLFDVAVVCGARIGHWQIVLHHHSYRYINRREWQTALLVCAAGAWANHILLCQDMRLRFSSHYGVAPAHTTAVSSIMFAEPVVRSMEPTVRERLTTIGYLGALSKEKGIRAFLSSVALLRDQGWNGDAHIAGPPSDGNVARMIEELSARDPRVRYWGAVYLSDKINFLRSVDALLLPSSYAHEAEPLVVYEALAASIPVIATSVGCLASPEELDGVIRVDLPNFDVAAVNSLTRWLRNDVGYRHASRAARATYEARMREADEAVDQLLGRELGDGYGNEPSI